MDTENPTGAAVAKVEAENVNLRDAATFREARIAKLQADLERARKALRPFASAFERVTPEARTDVQSVQDMRSYVGFAHFRAASSAMNSGD